MPEGPAEVRRHRRDLDRRPRGSAATSVSTSQVKGVTRGGRVVIDFPGSRSPGHRLEQRHDLGRAQRLVAQRWHEDAGRARVFRIGRCPRISRVVRAPRRRSPAWIRPHARPSARARDGHRPLGRRGAHPSSPELDRIDPRRHQSPRPGGRTCRGRAHPAVRARAGERGQGNALSPLNTSTTMPLRARRESKARLAGFAATFATDALDVVVIVVVLRPVEGVGVGVGEDRFVEAMNDSASPIQQAQHFEHFTTWPVFLARSCSSRQRWRWSPDRSTPGPGQRDYGSRRSPATC